MWLQVDLPRKGHPYRVRHGVNDLVMICRGPGIDKAQYRVVRIAQSIGRGPPHPRQRPVAIRRHIDHQLVGCHLVMHPVRMGHQNLLSRHHPGHDRQMPARKPRCWREDHNRSDPGCSAAGVVPIGPPPPIRGVPAEPDTAQRPGKGCAFERGVQPYVALWWDATGGKSQHQQPAKKQWESAHPASSPHAGPDRDRGARRKQVKTATAIPGQTSGGVETRSIDVMPGPIAVSPVSGPGCLRHMRERLQATLSRAPYFFRRRSILLNSLTLC